MAPSADADTVDVTAEGLPGGRCCYVHDVSTIHDVGEAVCWRPVWEDRDRCVWHAESDDKPLKSFEDSISSGAVRLDGAYIPNVEIIDRDWFEGSTLVGATFVSTAVRRSSFRGADLREARLENVDARHADFSSADLNGATIEATDFRTATLRDIRFDQAVLSNTRVNRETDFGEEFYDEKRLDDISSNSEYRRRAEAAVWTFREIHSLYVENALPLEARRFYYKEKNTRRRLAWHMGNYGQAIKAESSRWVTGYGMNPYRVVGTAALVIAASAFLYPLTGGIEETTGEQAIIWTLDDLSTNVNYIVFVYLKSLYFSIITFTTLGYGDIRPVGNLARTIAGIESLLGALLTAILVFVLSRRIS